MMTEVVGAGVRRPGAVEDVLARTMGGQSTPYEWLARAVALGASRVLDLGCGAGAMVERLAAPGRMVVGVEHCLAGLTEAASRGRGPLVLGHLSYLPFADDSFDAVVSSLGVGTTEDRGRFLAEAARVLRPGGVFAALTPSLWPASMEDLRLAGRLTRVLRVAPHLPGVTEFKAREALSRAGMTLAEDKRARYHYRVEDIADAQRLIAGLRAPVEDGRESAAVGFLQERLTEAAVLVPLPMRRLIAIK